MRLVQQCLASSDREGKEIHTDLGKDAYWRKRMRTGEKRSENDNLNESHEGYWLQIVTESWWNCWVFALGWDRMAVSEMWEHLKWDNTETDKRTSRKEGGTGLEEDWRS